MLAAARCARFVDQAGAGGLVVAGVDELDDGLDRSRVRLPGCDDRAGLRLEPGGDGKGAVQLTRRAAGRTPRAAPRCGCGASRRCAAGSGRAPGRCRCSFSLKKHSLPSFRRRARCGSPIRSCDGRVDRLPGWRARRRPGCIRLATFCAVTGMLPRICSTATVLATSWWKGESGKRIRALPTALWMEGKARRMSFSSASYSVTVVASQPTGWSATGVWPSSPSIRMSWMTLIAERRPMPPVDLASAPSRCSRMSKWAGRNGYRLTKVVLSKSAS